MCGAKLLPAALASAPVAVSAAQASAPSLRSSSPPSAPASFPAKPQAVTPSRPVAAVSEDAPVISGPSFLGLNTPAPRKQASLSSNPHSSSSNLDYLLEDEEEPRRGGGGKFILILLALALAVGFGYLRWKNQGLPWLHSGASKPPAADQAPDATDATSPAPPTPSTSAPAAASSTTQTPQQTSKDSASAAAPASSPSATNLAAGDPPATPDSGAPSASTSSPKADASSASETSTSSPDSSPPTESAATEPADKEPAAPDTPPAPTPKLKKPAAAVQPKPHAGITTAQSADPVSEAQKYIYGRGVSQDCERGMRLLKPAAAQANPKAMIEMGALYSAGLCTPHDLPTAYRWFAMALRKDPDNQPVQADLQKLWGEMTQPERQLAIKLSQ